MAPAVSADRGRNSSVELLRCLCIVLIIAHHYVFHGDIPALSAETWCAGRVFLQVIMLYGKTACNVFAILTGYYMSVSACRDHYKKWTAYYMQVLFYSLGCLFAMYILAGVKSGARQLLHAAFPLVYGNWYALYFLVLYLFIPFINRLLRDLSDRELAGLMMLSIVLWSAVPTVFRFRPDYGNLVFFLTMYILGAWLRRNESRFLSVPAYVPGITALVCVLIIAAPTLLLDTLRYGFGEDIAFLRNDEGYFATINSLPAVVCAAATVLWFQRKRFSSGPVNILARTVFGIYLIHDNEFVRPWLWNGIWPNAEHWTTPWLHAPAKIFAVFAACAAIELIRQKTLGIWFECWLDRRWERLARPRT